MAAKVVEPKLLIDQLWYPLRTARSAHLKNCIQIVSKQIPQHQLQGAHLERAFLPAPDAAGWEAAEDDAARFVAMLTV